MRIQLYCFPKISTETKEVMGSFVPFWIFKTPVCVWICWMIPFNEPLLHTEY